MKDNGTRKRLRWTASMLAFALCTAAPLSAQSAVPVISPAITKIDPPNWFAAMPKPMLLVNGEHLDGATFQLSDSLLHLERVHISANGHWVELWLDRSPASPETIQITATRNGAQVKTPFTFAPRHDSTDGFSGFSSKDVMYLIMTDRFANGDPSNDHQPWDSANQKQKVRGWHGGDLKGILQHLDYIQALGVTTVWITPVYANHGPESYHGYGATDMYAVDEHYGTLADLQALAAALHARGMKLVLDMVPNHVSAVHPWVTDSPEPDWFHGTKEHHTEAQGNFAPLTDPHSAWRDRENVTLGWFADVLPDMNQENPAASQYLIQNAEWWVEEAGIDGIRLDTFPYVGRQFWQDFHAALHQLYPNLTTVGEVFNPDATIVSSFAGGITRNGVDTGLYTPFDFPTYFALRDVFLRDAPMTRLADVSREDALYPHPERLVPFLGNHDTRRFLSEPGATPEKLKLAFAVLTTMRGMPEIYSGDEIAMRGGDDPDNRRNFPGGFAEQAAAPGPATIAPHSAFTLNARTGEESDMHDWVTALLHLRGSHPQLQTGEEQLLLAKNGLFAYVRGTDLNSGCSPAANQKGDATDERILIAVNNGDESATLTIPSADTSLADCSLSTSLLGQGGSMQVTGSSIQLTLAARQVGIFSLSATN
jgi:glycosidase